MRQANDWTLERMAELAHVTPRHLTRLFKAHAGLTPREHVEQVRLTLAQEAKAAGLHTKTALEVAGFRSDRQVAARPQPRSGRLGL
jgi:transcriptional regulator GlxA family with amidase domain